MSRPQTPPPPVGERIVDVVSVQSQVAYGNVGNNIAVPVLQALGLQVAPVPTVVFGNTPHYPTMHGGPLPLDWFRGLLDDLEAREAATRAKRVLVGYLGSPEQGIALAEWLRRMQEVNPALRVQIDPVIGDHDYGIYTEQGDFGVSEVPDFDSNTTHQLGLDETVELLLTVPEIKALARAGASA